MYTISVGAIGVDGNPSPFDEPCSAKMVVTYVTNSLGALTVVGHGSQNLMGNNTLECFVVCNRVLLILMKAVHLLLEEQVQQLLWLQE